MLDEYNRPLSVSSDGNDEKNVILWLDHRAKVEAEFINKTGHDILKYVGGRVSLEMQIPKLLWLKKNRPLSCWNHARYFFDLPDFLTWRSTGDDSRSLCSVVCKWNYDAENETWPKDYFEKIGLEDLANDNYQKIGNSVKCSGLPVGTGLSVKAAFDLGLLPNIPVGHSMIDAHAGALALLGADCRNDNGDLSLFSKLALICGTSSCHMSLCKEPTLVPGVWGPYKSALYADLFLHEAGQSATGILLDELIKTHPAYGSTIRNSGPSHHIYQHLNDVLLRLQAESKLDSGVHELTRDFHIWPDFHGNRSPIADPTLRGMLSGLTLTQDENNLAVFYLTIVQGLAYATRHIIEALKAAGRGKFEGIIICGGLSKNEMFNQTHADICGIPVYVPEETESVLLGAAILGSLAAKVFPDILSASKAMGGNSKVILPKDSTTNYHNRKYKVFLKMLDDQMVYKNIMNEI